MTQPLSKNSKRTLLIVFFTVFLDLVGFGILIPIQPFYAEGLGAVTNTPRTGAAAPSNPLAEALATVRVTLGGVPCVMQFAGLAPGFAGVYQVNFRVPPGVPAGLRDLVLSAGGVEAPAVRLPVR